MDTSNWIALVALLLSAVALATSVYNALINRPRLRVDVRNDIVIFTNPKNKEGPFIQVTVTNVGTQPTTVTSIGFSAYDHSWTPKFGSIGKKAVLMGGGHSTRLPKALGPGEYLDFFTNEDDDLYDRLLNKPACYAVVYHSWGKLPKMQRVKLARPT